MKLFHLLAASTLVCFLAESAVAKTIIRGTVSDKEKTFQIEFTSKPSRNISFLESWSLRVKNTSITAGSITSVHVDGLPDGRQTVRIPTRAGGWGFQSAAKEFAFRRLSSGVAVGPGKEKEFSVNSDKSLFDAIQARSVRFGVDRNDVFDEIDWIAVSPENILNLSDALGAGGFDMNVFEDEELIDTVFVSVAPVPLPPAAVLLGGSMVFLLFLHRSGFRKKVGSDGCEGSYKHVS